MFGKSQKSSRKAVCANCTMSPSVGHDVILLIAHGANEGIQTLLFVPFWTGQGNCFPMLGKQNGDCYALKDRGKKIVWYLLSISMD